MCVCVCVCVCVRVCVYVCVILRTYFMRLYASPLTLQRFEFLGSEVNFSRQVQCPLFTSESVLFPFGAGMQQVIFCFSFSPFGAGMQQVIFCFSPFRAGMQQVTFFPPFGGTM